jgi:hypothetical protein
MIPQSICLAFDLITAIYASNQNTFYKLMNFGPENSLKAGVDCWEDIERLKIEDQIELPSAGISWRESMMN